MHTINLELLATRPGMAVLDAGSGPGRHAIGLLRLGCKPVALDMCRPDLKEAVVNLKCTWLDMTQPQLPAAFAANPPPPPSSPAPRLMGDALNPQADPARLASSGAAAAQRDGLPWLVTQADALRLPFPDGAFPRVICSEVLEHVDDPAQAARELVRVLAPGGLLAVSVPTPHTEWACYFSSDDYFRTPGGHVRIFTPGRLRTLLEAQGLEVVDFHLEHGLHSFYWWLRCAVGLHQESHPLIRLAKWLMGKALFSPAALRLERALNWITPKAMVMYGHKRS